MRGGRACVVLALLPLVLGSMEPLTGVTSDQGLAGLQIGDAHNPMALLSLRRNPYSEDFTSEGYEQAQKSLDSNVNTVMSMLMGSQTSSERNSIHEAIKHQGHQSHQGPASFDSASRTALVQESSGHSEHRSSHGHHYSHQHHRHHHSESEDEMSDGREALIQEEPQHHQAARSHHSPSHHSSSSHSSHSSHGGHESHHQSSHGHAPSHHASSRVTHRAPSSHKSHRRATKSSGPSQIADVIEQLEVEGDGGKNFPDPHLRDKLVKPHGATRMHRGVPSKAPPPAVGRASTEDEVPLDEFGLKKDCHWIQMDFTQSSDNCNQCMTVADAYFRGDDVCVCYHDKPGSPMRTKCTELANKFKENEDHIRELAVENQWNEYFKSYGLCENFGHCGA